MSNLATAPKSPFHFNLGQIFGFALLGLEAYSQVNASGGPSIFLSPAVTESYMQGVATVLAAKSQVPMSDTPPPTA